MSGFGFGFGFGNNLHTQGVEVNVFEQEFSLYSPEAATDFVMPLMLHRSTNESGFNTGRDVYFQNKCKTDFSDVVFYDGLGNKLDSFITNVTPTDLQYNQELPEKSIIINNTTIVGNRAEGVVLSTDNGATWTLIHANAVISFVDSRGYIYVSSDGLYRRSIDMGANWTTVLYLTSVATSFIDKETTCEDADGNIYAGVYQDSYNPRIFKSTDEGATFVDVFSTSSFPTRPQNTVVTRDTYVRPTVANGHLYKCIVAGTTADASDPVWPTALRSTVTDGTVTWAESALQHVHGMSFDTYTGYIYASFDGDAAIFKSIDGGTTWVKILSQDSRYIICGDGFRLFGAGAYQFSSRYAIIKTTDDVNFYPVLQNLHCVQGMAIDTDGIIYANNVSYKNGNYPSILRSVDDGETWETLWQGVYDNLSNFNGLNVFSNIGTLGGKKQILVGYGIGYTSARLLFNNYSAVAYVKLPSVDNAVKLIIKTGNSNPNSSLLLANDKAPLIRVKFDEGTGTPIDSSVNTFATELTSGTWSLGGRYVSPIFPRKEVLNSSISFNSNGKLVVASPVVSKAFTAFAWVKTSTYNTTYMRVFSNLLDNNGWSLAIRNGALVFEYGNGSFINAMQTIAASPVIGFADDKWHMIGITVSDTPYKVKFIFDGITADRTFTSVNGSTDLLNEPTASAKYFTIGENFVGQISDVHFYDKILTATDLREIYEGREVLTKEPSLLEVNTLPNLLLDGKSLIFLNSKNTTSADNKLSVWGDYLASGTIISQAVALNKPTKTATGILFNGDSSKMASNYLALVQPTTIYLLVKQVTWADVQYILDGRDSDCGAIIQRLSTPNLRFYAGAALDATGTPLGEYGTIAVVYNGANSIGKVNANNPVTGSLGTRNMYSIRLGTGGSGVKSANFEIKALIIRKNADTLENIEAIRTYLLTLQ